MNFLVTLDAPMFVLWENLPGLSMVIYYKRLKRNSLPRGVTALAANLLLIWPTQRPLQLAITVTTTINHHSEHYEWSLQWPWQWPLCLTASVTTRVTAMHDYQLCRHYNWLPQWLTEANHHRDRLTIPVITIADRINEHHSEHYCWQL